MVRDSQISRRTFLGGVAGTLVSIGLPGTFMVLAEPVRQAVAAQVSSCTFMVTWARP